MSTTLWMKLGSSRRGDAIKSWPFSESMEGILARRQLADIPISQCFGAANEARTEA
jgi:hypothetical protein